MEVQGIAKAAMLSPYRFGKDKANRCNFLLDELLTRLITTTDAPTTALTAKSLRDLFNEMGSAIDTGTELNDLLRKSEQTMRQQSESQTDSILLQQYKNDVQELDARYQRGLEENRKLRAELTKLKGTVGNVRSTRNRTKKKGKRT